jgi:apolipoprotein N-acyltransferase
VLNGAGFLVNQTNDAWFDGTAAPEQHMTHCVFRCVENRVDAVRSANTGVTCFIRSTGEVEPLDGADPACGAFAVGRVMARGVSAVPTRYTRFGDAQFAAPCAALALLSLALVARRASGQRRSASPANRA